MSEKLSKEEFERYDRQIPVIGLENQLKLKNSSVLVVGLGGLGSAVSYYLAAAGVGKLVLVDRENVEISNLQRQVLYTVNDIGKPKAFVARERLLALNNNIIIEAYAEEFTRDLGEKLVPKVDVVIDALDNWETREILDSLAYKYGKPLIHAGVEEFYGQLTVIIPGKTPCLRQLFSLSKRRRRNRVNVLATVPGILGLLEAHEAIKLITGKGEVLANKLLIFDGLRSEFTIVNISGEVDRSICYQ
ncbi:MAG: HesA/MoeB/ThiF family protein [Thermoprotei archaeon]